MKSLLCAVGAALIALSTIVGSADASVVIAGTRVVFPAANGEVTVRLNNDGSQPALVEAWIDSGDPASTPDTANVPFLITPPLVRMNAGKGQSLRIVYTGQPLPKDRESLFWLNVLEIPPKPTAKPGEEQNTLQFAVRSRLKLFFRPPNLADEPNAAARQVTWKVVADGNGYALEVHNPTPYYITFSKLSLSVDNVSHMPGNGMVAPLSTLHLPVKDLARAPAAGTVVDYTTINDFGAATTYKGAISP
ncbi:molecular chaperone [Rhodanobacter glycinis]|uniref:Molecular chaperone n=1 Tax=Rhodanobacter glycinis TaxID=582702 RepID=A0A502C192_9GAMM|nr:fimbria/pilus periplasmic chaperone [Rhodanobacter glycinis]TPG06512.1 molecular chaperone [Rhodanobacter glycinis]TPG45943.1 molecular chaperone [Rhodanobacter glycinis]